MSFTVGEKIKLSIFGQSHAPAIGGVIDGLPSGESLDIAAIERFLARRSPGGSPLATARRESDVPEVLAGLTDGKTCGAPLAFVIRNADVRSNDYGQFHNIPRPSHSDFPAIIKYGEAHDIRGGGFFSARLTAALCFAGAAALQLLERRGIRVGAHIAELAGVKDSRFDAVNLTESELLLPSSRVFPVLDEAAGEKMQAAILEAKREGDSVGGVVECAAIGLPAGLGEPLFSGAESKIAQLIFAIPAVKGLEFGEGFGISALRGSQANDRYCEPQGAALRCESNNNGGILGGLTTGMPLVLRAAFKPTPSIAREQLTWSRSSKRQEPLVIPGRHDPCVVPRAVPCVEAALALALLDLLCLSSNA
ncbi:MAG: chorismate synthase [Clostridium sp.]|jgi:chorismate synthase|nr:chorismate synthase [Clostridium sp.]